VCAPSGGNMQRWRFLVIRDAAIKQKVGAFYKRAWDEQVAPRYRSGEPAPGMSRERFLRLLDAAEYLAAHIHEAPVWIVPCLEGGTPTRTSGSSIYPAVQNMLLAARARPRIATSRSPGLCRRAGLCPGGGAAGAIVAPPASAIIRTQDLLKNRGYAWSPGDLGRPRCWYRDVFRRMHSRHCGL
jgi:hypothetical protein